ncbi:MAG TPA: protein kinase [Burkholderiaceae bacterium]|nr:protein kinase [Burkholderiaceae bacterium]
MSANDDGRPGVPGARPTTQPDARKPEPDERTRLMTPPPRPGKGDGDDGFEPTRFMPRQTPEPEAEDGTVVIPAGSPLRSQLSRAPAPPQAPPLRPLPPLPTPGTAPEEPGDAEATQLRPRTPVAPPRPPTQPRADTDPGFGRPSTFSSGLPGHTLTGKDNEGTGPIVGDSPVRQVGRYLIQSRLGRGGMATVYKAHDPQINRSVAIKFLHASLAEDAEFHARFLREARAAGGLSHPNIVVVHDVGEIEGRPYMAMELVDGVPLSDQLDKGKPLPIRDAVVVGLQLARALDYAHAHGIVHRDIKPGNILMLADQKTVKVTDFGIAHMDDAGQQHTQVGAVMGTPQYMSPEQTRGEKLDGRSDLFSAGIVLYQMVTGERPFKGESLVAVATRIANDPPPPLAQRRPDAPASLRRVVERCLAKQPSQRFQSGKEMADGLLKVLAELDEAAREKAKPRIVPLRVKWALSMAAIVAVVMGITAAIITQRQYAALMGQAIEYGSSLARFIARQNAAPALAEEWEVVDVAVQEMMKTGNFERIVVMDPSGVVRASSQTALVGKPYTPAGTEPLSKLAGGAAAFRYHVNDESILGFEAPATFQDKLVGRVALGVAEKPLTQVAQLSITLMTVLLLITVAAVALAMYFLADWFAKPIRLVGESMREIAKGNYTHRIAESRKDEFGLLFADFDAMAQSLQDRDSTRAPSSPVTLANMSRPPTITPATKS